MSVRQRTTDGVFTNIRVMQPQIETDVHAKDGRMHGIRRWKYLVYPLLRVKSDFRIVLFACSSRKGQMG